ncbi:MAG: hypothetical protein HN467_11605 [Opitutae bacterium]|nr:hypothetical protein [Opitutae bacterium]
MRDKVSGWFKRGVVAFFCLGLAGMWSGCPKKAGTPVLRANDSNDFNVSLANFLEMIPPDEREPVVHALILIATKDMDPANYTGKTARDLQSLSLDEVFKFGVNGKTSSEILHQAQRRFLEGRQTLDEELSGVRSQLDGIRAKLETQTRREEMLNGLLVKDFNVLYEMGPFKIMAYVNFRINNQSTTQVYGLTFRTQFFGKTAQSVSPTEDKQVSFEDPINPGSGRDFRFLASNCPTLTGVATNGYREQLQASVTVVNASLDGGRPLIPTIPDLQLEQNRDDLLDREAELLRLLDVSEERRSFSFWSYLNRGYEN